MAAPAELDDKPGRTAFADGPRLLLNAEEVMAVRWRSRARDRARAGLPVR